MVIRPQCREREEQEVGVWEAGLFEHWALRVFRIYDGVAWEVGGIMVFGAVFLLITAASQMIPLCLSDRMHFPLSSGLQIDIFGSELCSLCNLPYIV